MLEMIEPLVLTIPGIFVTLGAQIVAEIGDIGRFRSGASVAKYAGLNSGVSQSGEVRGQRVTHNEDGIALSQARRLACRRKRPQVRP